MKIRIRPSDSWFRLTLWFPLGFLKSRLVARGLAEAMKEDASKEEILAVRAALKDSYKFIKGYVKEHGHFYLVDIKSHDGDRVYIRV